MCLVREQRRPDGPDLLPLNSFTGKLLAKLLEVPQSLATVDQVCVRDRIDSTGEQIGKTDLIAYVGGQHRDGQIEGTGHLLENIPEEFALGGMSSRETILI